MKEYQREKVGVLYVSYDGMLEPLGQSQVLAYLKEIAKDYSIHLISFEKDNYWKNSLERKQISLDIASFGIHWNPLRYHKRPTSLATLWDIVAGIFIGLHLVFRYRLKIVHARSYVPSVMALIIKRFIPIKFIFDMRGFWADERVDGGLWPKEGKLYRIAKTCEKRFLLNADHVVSLTNAAVEELKKFPYLINQTPPITVISTCANLEIFSPPKTQNLKKDFTLGYVGSIGTWYLFDEVLECFNQLLLIKPSAKLIIVNRDSHKFIFDRLTYFKIPQSSVKVVSAQHREIPNLMAQMNAGIFFIKPEFSKIASAPTKLAEFLGCGVPCLSNSGVGDMEEQLRENLIGVTVNSFDSESLKKGIEDLLNLVSDPNVSERCVNSAKKYFSLENGVKLYNQIYYSLSKS
jgi:glycosyltransferase involved in cell wall biosynthesis